MKKDKRSTTSLYLERELVKTAKELGLNISKVCEIALVERIRLLSSLEGRGWCGGRDLNPRRPEPRDFLPERDLKSRPFDQSRVPPRLFDVRGHLLLSLWFQRGLFFYLGVLFLCWSWARSAVWIARRPPKPEVVGSNPTGPATSSRRPSRTRRRSRRRS